MKITIDERVEATGIEVAIVCRKTDRQVLDIAARHRREERALNEKFGEYRKTNC